MKNAFIGPEFVKIQSQCYPSSMKKILGLLAILFIAALGFACGGDLEAEGTVTTEHTVSSVAAEVTPNVADCATIRVQNASQCTYSRMHLPLHVRILVDPRRSVIPLDEQSHEFHVLLDMLR